MSFRSSRGLGLLAAIAVSLPVLALAQEPVAPQSTYNGRPVEYAILIDGYGSTPDWDNPPLRLAQPLVDPVDWFSADSQLAKAYIADPDALGFARLTLEIDEAGTIAACAPVEAGKFPVDDAAVCGDFAKQKFRPALDNDGTRIPGGYLVTFTQRRFEIADSPRPMFTRDRGTVAAPMQAPRVDSMYSFPPSPLWMRSLYREPQWQTVPMVGLPKDGPPQPLTAIVVFDKGAGRDCRVIERSGVAAQDNAACTYAKSVLKPVWPDASAQNHRGVPLYVGGQGEATVAYTPDPDYQRTTTITDEVELRLISAMTNAGLFPNGREASPLRITLKPDAQGHVAQCRIVTSTGNDAGDIAACRISRQTVVMQPTEDIFGRMSEYAGLTWAADPSAP